MINADLSHRSRTNRVDNSLTVTVALIKAKMAAANSTDRLGPLYG